MMSTYAWILTASLALPLLLSFHPKIRFDRQWKAFGMSCLIVSGIFILWDAQFTHGQIWGFNSNHHSGWLILGMPLEEILFFIVIPYCCIFTYEVLMVVGITTQRNMNKVHLGLGVLSAVLSVIFIDNMYTSTVCIALAIVCLVPWGNQEWLSHAYLSYAILLIPFVIVNSLLTGSFVNEEVVWYSDQAIIGLRIGTIPVEDFIYCFAMIFSQVAVYERVKSWSNEKKWKRAYFQVNN